MNKETKEEYQENMPYTVVSHTSTPMPMISLLLTAKGIKELAKRMNDGDMVRIEEWSDYTEECEKEKCYGHIKIIRKLK